MLLRLLDTGDASAAADLESRTLGNEAYSEESFRETLALSYAVYMGLWEEELLLGLAGARIIAGEAEISNVSVRPERRNEGLGSKVLSALTEELSLRGVTDLSLEVRASNRAAIRLYEKAGFKQEGVRPGLYERPKEDALIMWRH